MKFNELNISEEMIKAIDRIGYTEMTEIQEKSIPLLLEGRDVIGRSNTGTGKTAAFGIPAVECINDTNRKKVTVLILCPTRELAMQANDEIKKFAYFKHGVKTVSVFGGASMERQILQLKHGANIVIGTPGRVMDHMRRRTLKLDEVKMIILDEADEMLNMGFREDIETILSDVPEERQTVLFSATMPKAILEITDKFQHDPVQVKIQTAQRTVELIDQYYFETAMGRKTDALKLLLTAYSPSSAMIFCNTKKMVDELTEELVKSGFRAAGLHGDMKQMQRTSVMNSFKAGTTAILIATDVAARGIDVSGVDCVINYDIPQDNEYYIHRIGRTGRAGRAGKAYTLVTGRRQVNELREISRYIKAEITELPLPDRSDVIDIKIRSMSEDIAGIEERPAHSAYEVLEALASKGIDYREAAARLIDKQLKEQIAALPEFDIPKPLKKGRHSGAKTVKLNINIGRSRRIAPNFILGALVEATGMPGSSFGKIDIYDEHTTVEVPESEAEFIIEAANPMRINRTPVKVEFYKGSDKGGFDRKRPGGKPDRKKMAYGNKRRKDVFSDYTSDRKKRSKSRRKG